MRKARAAAFASAGFALVLALLPAACGTDATNIDGCRKIEEARCRRAPACGVDLSRIASTGTSSEDAVAGCIRYYHEACLHGTVVTGDPGAGAVQSCVDAVANGTCDVVKAPESSAPCNWLVPPAAAPPVDAGSDAAVDARADGP